MNTIGEALVIELERRGVELVFGIPGVHTIELYRALAKSSIRHITPRHEQGAGFMADGYARVSGKPGVAFVITGPGLTNTLTAMGQARADSVPILVVSGANIESSLGKGLGHLHEMPDQQALAKTLALESIRVTNAGELQPAIEKAFTPFHTGRPGPTHIEIPLDVAGLPFDATENPIESVNTTLDTSWIAEAAGLLSHAKSPLILVGGGARLAAHEVQTLSETLDAPVVQTVNARGLMHKHPLCVPASPSLNSVRALIEASDVVIAIGTELGQTDYDMNATGTMPTFNQLIRIDRCPKQLVRYAAKVSVEGDSSECLRSLNDALRTAEKTDTASTGESRAQTTRTQAYEEVGDYLRNICVFLDALREAVPNAIMVGDSTQPMYAGNLYYDHDRVGGWFNAATGFGALGYGIPAAIGASLASPDDRVICITGDGGAQFSLPEIMTAVEEKLPIVFLIWNNHGYQEIATWMQAANIEVVGCDPTPPNFSALADAFGIEYWKCSSETVDVKKTVLMACKVSGPTIVEVQVPNLSRA